MHKLTLFIAVFGFATLAWSSTTTTVWNSVVHTSTSDTEMEITVDSQKSYVCTNIPALDTNNPNDMAKRCVPKKYLQPSAMYHNQCHNLVTVDTCLGHFGIGNQTHENVCEWLAPPTSTCDKPHKQIQQDAVFGTISVQTLIGPNTQKIDYNHMIIQNQNEAGDSRGDFSSVDQVQCAFESSGTGHNKKDTVALAYTRRNGDDKSWYTDGNAVIKDYTEYTPSMFFERSPTLTGLGNQPSRDTNSNTASQKTWLPSALGDDSWLNTDRNQCGDGTWEGQSASGDGNCSPQKAAMMVPGDNITIYYSESHYQELDFYPVCYKYIAYGADLRAVETMPIKSEYDAASKRNHYSCEDSSFDITASRKVRVPACQASQPSQPGLNHYRVVRVPLHNAVWQAQVGVKKSGNQYFTTSQYSFLMTLNELNGQYGLNPPFTVKPGEPSVLKYFSCFNSAGPSSGTQVTREYKFTALTVPYHNGAAYGQEVTEDTSFSVVFDTRANNIVSTSNKHVVDKYEVHKTRAQTKKLDGSTTNHATAMTASNSKYNRKLITSNQAPDGTLYTIATIFHKVSVTTTANIRNLVDLGYVTLEVEDGAAATCPASSYHVYGEFIKSEEVEEVQTETIVTVDKNGNTLTYIDQNTGVITIVQDLTVELLVTNENQACIGKDVTIKGTHQLNSDDSNSYIRLVMMSFEVEPKYDRSGVALFWYDASVAGDMQFFYNKVPLPVSFTDVSSTFGSSELYTIAIDWFSLTPAPVGDSVSLNRMTSNNMTVQTADTTDLNGNASITWLTHSSSGKNQMYCDWQMADTFMDYNAYVKSSAITDIDVRVEPQYAIACIRDHSHSMAATAKQNAETSVHTSTKSSQPVEATSNDPEEQKVHNVCPICHKHATNGGECYKQIHILMYRNSGFTIAQLCQKEPEICNTAGTEFITEVTSTHSTFKDYTQYDSNGRPQPAIDSYGEMINGYDHLKPCSDENDSTRSFMILVSNMDQSNYVEAIDAQFPPAIVGDWTKSAKRHSRDGKNNKFQANMLLAYRRPFSKLFDEVKIVIKNNFTVISQLDTSAGRRLLSESKIVTTERRQGGNKQMDNDNTVAKHTHTTSTAPGFVNSGNYASCSSNIVISDNDNKIIHECVTPSNETSVQSPTIVNLSTKEEDGGSNTLWVILIVLASVAIVLMMCLIFVDLKSYKAISFMDKRMSAPNYSTSSNSASNIQLGEIKVADGASSTVARSGRMLF